jgi:hypothetical protein
MSKRDALPDAEPVIADFTQGPVKDLLGACDQCADLLLTVRALEFAVIGFCWFCDQFTAAEDDFDAMRHAARLATDATEDFYEALKAGNKSSADDPPTPKPTGGVA